MVVRCPSVPPTTLTRRALVLALAIPLAGGVAGWGDDDEDGDATAASATTAAEAAAEDQPERTRAPMPTLPPTPEAGASCTESEEGNQHDAVAGKLECQASGGSYTWTSIP